MKQKLYVFGFDNTLVNGEDLIVEITAKTFNINLTKDFWYKNLHSVADPATETRILEETFGVNYTPELQQKVGKEFIERLCKTEPSEAVFKLFKENIAQSYILTGCPAFIVQKYLQLRGIEFPEKNIYGGVYNGSGKKEELLAEFQKKNDVIYIDDDAGLISNASKIVSEAILVKQEYNKDSWDKFKTI